MSESIARKRQSIQRSTKILESALELFCSNGMEETSIEEVAKHAGIGTATVYRYFSTKAELAISSAIFYWEKISDKYIRILTTHSYQHADGAGQLKQILHLFVELFEKEYSFWKFLYEFDAFVMKYQIPWERLEEYEACILNLKSYVTGALQKGLQDGSLYFSHSVDEMYFTLTHLMLSLMQKLSAGGRMIPSDERVALSLQVQIAGEILLQGLSSLPTKQNDIIKTPKGGTEV